MNDMAPHDRESETEPPASPDPHAAVVELLAELKAAPHRPVRRWDVLRGAALILLPVCLFLGALCWAFDSLVWGGSRYYSRLPAATVFRRVLGYPVPKGVTELRAAGTSGPIGLKHQVWMSFRVQPDAARELVEGVDPLERRHVEYSLTGPTDVRYGEQHRTQVGWSEIARIREPEFYWLSSGGPGELIWMVTLVLDRRNGRAYIHAVGD